MLKNILLPICPSYTLPIVFFLWLMHSLFTSEGKQKTWATNLMTLTNICGGNRSAVLSLLPAQYPISFPANTSTLLSRALLISRDNSLVAPQKWHEKCVSVWRHGGKSMKSMKTMNEPGWAGLGWARGRLLTNSKAKQTDSHQTVAALEPRNCEMQRDLSAESPIPRAGPELRSK